MLPFPSRLTRPGLAIAGVLALSAPAALVEWLPQTAPGRIETAAPPPIIYTQAAGVMAPVHYPVFFRRASRSGHGAYPWWARGRTRWRT